MLNELLYIPLPSWGVLTKRKILMLRSQAPGGVRDHDCWEVT